MHRVFLVKIDKIVEVQATDTTHSPELNRTLPSADEGAIAGATEIDSPLLAGSSYDDKLHIPRQRQQPTIAKCIYCTGP